MKKKVIIGVVSTVLLLGALIGGVIIKTQHDKRIAEESYHYFNV